MSQEPQTTICSYCGTEFDWTDAEPPESLVNAEGEQEFVGVCAECTQSIQENAPTEDELSGKKSFADLALGWLIIGFLGFMLLYGIWQVISNMFS